LSMLGKRLYYKIFLFIIKIWAIRRSNSSR